MYRKIERYLGAGRQIIVWMQTQRSISERSTSTNTAWESINISKKKKKRCSATLVAYTWASLAYAGRSAVFHRGLIGEFTTSRPRIQKCLKRTRQRSTACISKWTCPKCVTLVESGTTRRTSSELSDLRRRVNESSMAKNSKDTVRSLPGTFAAYPDVSTRGIWSNCTFRDFPLNPRGLIADCRTWAVFLNRGLKSFPLRDVRFLFFFSPETRIFAIVLVFTIRVTYWQSPLLSVRFLANNIAYANMSN